MALCLWCVHAWYFSTGLAICFMSRAMHGLMSLPCFLIAWRGRRSQNNLNAHKTSLKFCSLCTAKSLGFYCNSLHPTFHHCSFVYLPLPKFLSLLFCFIQLDITFFLATNTYCYFYTYIPTFLSPSIGNATWSDICI
jgi:hypothetical protein